MEKVIDFIKFKQLLATMEHTDVMIRIRCSGEKWGEFSDLLLLTENAMILQENSRRRIIMNLRSIVEFEIDQRVIDLEANCQYAIVV